jgi:3-oxoacyl-[acyl-carrier protein] reductase
VKSPQGEMPLSNSARLGLVGFVAGLSRQTVRHNVTINNLLPGPFETDRLLVTAAKMAQNSGRTVTEELDARRASNPAKRLGDPAEFGDACAYLCSAQAGFITGQNLLMDGGHFPGVF